MMQTGTCAPMDASSPPRPPSPRHPESPSAAPGPADSLGCGNDRSPDAPLPSPLVRFEARYYLTSPRHRSLFVRQRCYVHYRATYGRWPAPGARRGLPPARNDGDNSDGDNSDVFLGHNPWKRSPPRSPLVRQDAFRSGGPPGSPDYRSAYRSACRSAHRSAHRSAPSDAYSRSASGARRRRDPGQNGQRRDGGTRLLAEGVRKQPALGACGRARLRLPAGNALSGVSPLRHQSGARGGSPNGPPGEGPAQKRWFFDPLISKTSAMNNFLE
ncbi:unnamed protein product [Pseudo-nitzschia multistriata]|uniref:Uncharacterized protein n=1 Tax=Pseudo-nitzschia multistriata TaxID=183589 RepID=A0A448Z1P4_9STRA|nr:unnamed protein product [Pseudo-nitzschia multistriata]